VPKLHANLDTSKGCWFIVTAGRWSWKSKPAKECVTTHQPNELAPKTDGAKACLLILDRKRRRNLLRVGGRGGYKKENRIIN